MTNQNFHSPDSAEVKLTNCVISEMCNEEFKKAQEGFFNNVLFLQTKFSHR